MVQQTDALPLPLTLLSHLHILTTSLPKRFGATPTEVAVNHLSARGYTSVSPWLHTGRVCLFFRKVLLIFSGSPAFRILILVLWSVAKVLMIVSSYLVSRPDRPSHVWLYCLLCSRGSQLWRWSFGDVEVTFAWSDRGHVFSNTVKFVWSSSDLLLTHPIRTQVCKNIVAKFTCLR